MTDLDRVVARLVFHEVPAGRHPSAGADTTNVLVAAVEKMVAELWPDRGYVTRFPEISHDPLVIEVGVHRDIP